ncbi:MAG TPA: hypothetical protein GX696_08675 [Pseudomonadaceae bacterium]|nr:hypothetical protein [Pseudomonadaceae bacterium]
MPDHSTTTPTNAPRRSQAPLLLALAGSLVMLAACSDDTASNTGPLLYETNYVGVLKTAQGDYTFEPTTCGVYREDNVDDLEIHGPGTAPDGEAFFFELSSTAETMSLSLGVNKPMTHSDRVIHAGRWNSEPFVVAISEDGRKFSAKDIVLVDWNQNRIDGLASLEIDCSM